MIPFSVLDLSQIGEGSTVSDALANSARLAQAAEAHGYARFWLAEHHGMPGIASAATAAAIAHVGHATKTIRVGAGGIMLPNHAPLMVAEQFGTLEALHPGRVDLGIGRAPGTDQVTALALRRTMEGLSAEAFPQELADLISYFTGDEPRLRITATPGLGDMPAIWLLGSSGFSAQLAGILGLPFSFAHHFSSANTLPALALYRQHFQPSQWLDKPYAMVAVNAICAEDDERARFLAGSSGLSFLRLRTGRPGRVPSPEEAAAYPYSDAEREFIADRQSTQHIGGPERVTEGLTALIKQTGVGELMITTQTFDPADRLRSFELVAMAARAR